MDMNVNGYSNEERSINFTDNQQVEEVRQESGFFDFLYSLREENPWDEKDFDSIFMFL
jgi:hypothetical protein